MLLKSSLFASAIPVLCFVGLAVLFAQTDAPGQNVTAPPPLLSRAETQSYDLPSTLALQRLETIRETHGDIQTLEAEFNQVRLSKDFGDEVRSPGRLYIRMPRSLFCAYEQPEPEEIYFVGDAFYRYVPSIRTVYHVPYEDPQRAQDIFRALTLSFGLSSEKIIRHYRVTTGDGEEEGAFWLAFEPLDPALAQNYRQIKVWFDPETGLPRKVLLTQVANVETTLHIEKIKVNVPLEDAVFEPSFPEGTDVETM